MTLTPPFSPLSNVPLPRPPARTCALITISSPPGKSQLPTAWALECLVSTNLFCNRFCFGSRSRDLSLGHTNTVLSQYQLCNEISGVNRRTDLNRPAERYSCIDRFRRCCIQPPTVDSCRAGQPSDQRRRERPSTLTALKATAKVLLLASLNIVTINWCARELIGALR